MLLVSRYSYTWLGWSSSLSHINLFIRKNYNSSFDKSYSRFRSVCLMHSIDFAEKRARQWRFRSRWSEFSANQPTTNSWPLFHGFEAALRASKCVNWMTLAQSSTLLRIYIIAIIVQIVSGRFLVRISNTIREFHIIRKILPNLSNGLHPLKLSSDNIWKVHWISYQTDIEHRRVNTIVILSMIAHKCFLK